MPDTDADVHDKIDGQIKSMDVEMDVGAYKIVHRRIGWIGQKPCEQSQMHR